MGIVQGMNGPEGSCSGANCLGRNFLGGEEEGGVVLS